jgi:DNA-binding Lrp family transcriptional regulator
MCIGLKTNELRLVYELMKNSRRSDRELAKAIGSSQPTVSRMIKKLESEGIIKEYTIIPDFHKLGFEILAITFFNVEKEPDQQQVKKAIDTFHNVLMFERGIGLRHSCVIVSLHEDYSSYIKFMRQLQYSDLLSLSDNASFLVSLHEDRGFLSLSSLAEHLFRISSMF